MHVGHFVDEMYSLSNLHFKNVVPYLVLSAG